MATANSTGARRRADHPGRIAPTFPQSAADKAAHRASEYRRGDSAPSMDEALRRVTTDLAYLERKQQHDAQVAAEIALGSAA